MKRILFLVSFLCQLSFGLNAIIDCSSTTIATTYATSTPSLLSIFTGFTIRNQPTLMIANPGSVAICVNLVTASTSVAPTANNGHEHCVAPGQVGYFDAVETPRGPVNIYVRSNATSCTANQVYLDIY